MPSPPRIAISLSLILLFALPSSHHAIDLSRAFGKKGSDDTAAPTPVMTPEEALLNAKKLVNDMNDASTGTITSYQPGREKEPVTCNEIMAKSLVVVNEEKAALVAEKDAVVRAATLLTEQIDDLTAKLEKSTEDVAALERTLSVIESDHEERLKEINANADADMKEAEKLRNDERAAHEEKLKEALAAEEMKLEGERERHTFELQRAREEMEALESATAAKVAKMQQEKFDQLSAKDEELEKKLSEAEEELMRVQEEAASMVDSKEAEVMEKMAEMESGMELAKKELQALTDAHQKDAEARVAKIQSDAAEEKANLIESTQKQIDDANADAERQVNDLKAQMAAREEETAATIRKVKLDSMHRIKNLETEYNEDLWKVRDSYDAALDRVDTRLANEKEGRAADKKEAEAAMEQLRKEWAEDVAALKQAHAELLEAEQSRYRELEGETEKEKEVARQKERNLDGDIRLLRSNSFKLEKEVSSWKENYESRGYCNATMIKEDSRRFLTNAMDSVSRGFDNGHQQLVRSLSSQWDLAQSKGADALDYVKMEVFPEIERVASEAREKTIALYDEHLAEAVNQNLVPLYEQHVYPVYNQQILPLYKEHVSPVVKTIEEEASILADKSSKELQKVRSRAATLVKQSSSSALDVMKEKDMESMIPEWVVSQLVHTSEDGEWAVDGLSKGLLIVTVILCRSLILGLIGYILSWVWFFCPLRIFVPGSRRAKKTKLNGAKKKVMEVKKMKIEGGVKPTNGQSKVK
eukprot:CAMPEP_0183711974 /NCGR_PEP_ID=MMETSP0737-20130205/7280_1 /TAXON_ID=385413 /ORGANISM="Thalassiosira miniscula, Strain CCMP1093" /LENGTH=756 /DNA_ID=CAMNT_0025940547 /DNA_START=80 /DNA_END=2347 /DNA_ORIENTATION=-